MISELMISTVELGFREHSYSLCPRLPPLPRYCRYINPEGKMIALATYILEG